MNKITALFFMATTSLFSWNAEAFSQRGVSGNDVLEGGGTVRGRSNSPTEVVGGGAPSCDALCQIIAGTHSSQVGTAAQGVALAAGSWRTIPGSAPCVGGTHDVPCIAGFTTRAWVKANIDPSVNPAYRATIWNDSSGGPRNIFTDWGGSAYDPATKRMFFMGGGHGAASYGGNEVYQYDFDTLEWTRRSVPAPLEAPDPNCPAGRTCGPGPLLANGPPAVHTYDSMVWYPPTNQMILFPPLFPYNITAGTENWTDTTRLWKFNPGSAPDTGTWSYCMLQTIKDQGASFGGAAPEYDPATGKILVYSSTAGVFAVDPTNCAVSKWDFWQYGSGEGIAALRTVDGKSYGIASDGVRRINHGTPLTYTFVAALPQDVKDQRPDTFAWEYDSAHDKFVIWAGLRFTWTFNPVNNEWRAFDNALADNDGPVYDTDFGRATINTKWAWLADQGVFIGLAHPAQPFYIFKPATSGGLVLDPAAVRATNSRTGTTYTSLNAAVQAAAANDTIVGTPGSYLECINVAADKTGLTLNLTGVHLLGVTCNPGGAIVVAADNVTIKGLECSGVLGEAEACIRTLPTYDYLTLDSVNFHDVDMGFESGQEAPLGTPPTRGRLTIKNSVMTNCGGHNIFPGQSHCIYMGRGLSFTLQDSTIGPARKEGHQVKSRAATSIIERNQIVGLGGLDSSVIDLPCGGNNVIRYNTIEKGPNSSNGTIVGIDAEGQASWCGFAQQDLDFNHNIVINDYTGGGVTFIQYYQGGGRPPVGTVTVSNNVFVRTTGDTVNDIYSTNGNATHPNRAAAGFAAYPYIPVHP